MTQRTALAPEAAELAPVDLETMRATATRALALAAPPTVADLMLLLGLLRGQVELMVREVEPLAARTPDSVQQVAARYGIDEARRKLGISAGGPVSARLALARRLARSLAALCTHYETLAK